jgi:hypothetical protein
MHRQAPDGSVSLLAHSRQASTQGRAASALIHAVDQLPMPHLARLHKLHLIEEKPLIYTILS